MLGPNFLNLFVFSKNHISIAIPMILLQIFETYANSSEMAKYYKNLKIIFKEAENYIFSIFKSNIIKKIKLDKDRELLFSKTVLLLKQEN